MANLTPTDGADTEPRHCTHNNLFTRVLKTTLTCETTAIFCADCGQQRTTPETDC